MSRDLAAGMHCEGRVTHPLQCNRSQQDGGMAWTQLMGCCLCTAREILSTSGHHDKACWFSVADEQNDLEQGCGTGRAG